MKFYSKNKKTSAEKFFFLRKDRLVFLLAVIIAGAAIYAAVYSPLFRIKDIQAAVASDSSAVNKEELTAELKQFFDSRTFFDSILGSRNILVWDNDLSKFLNQHPQWQFLKIDKDYFKRQIVITGEERKKFGLWCQSAKASAGTTAAKTATDTTEMTGEKNNLALSKCQWFDEKGIIFLEAPSVESEIFNRVDDYSGRELEMGNFVLPEEMIGNLVAVFNILETAGVNARTAILKDLALEEISVEPKSGPRLIFSLNREPSFVAPAIDSLKKSGQWDKLQYVNFTVENRAYYK